MRPVAAIFNIVLGLVYTSYGIMTLLDMRRGWKTNGFSHFGTAWVAMAFTCGPHHLEHGLHIAYAGRPGGAFDLLSVVVGFPAGVIWFLLRVEALAGGRGDRFVKGTPRWVAMLPWVSGGYLLTAAVAAVLVLRHGAHFGPRLTSNVLLLELYMLVGYYLLRSQLANRHTLGGWSLSGLTLTAVFPTCALMHTMWLSYAATGYYDVDWHGLVIDWLSVPAAIYFLWVTRSLYLGSLRDWNDRATGVRREPVEAAA